MRANLKGKVATITDQEMVNIIIEDLEHMDADVFDGLIEYLYPVTATSDCGLVTVKPNSDMEQSGMGLEEIF